MTLLVPDVLHHFNSSRCQIQVVDRLIYHVSVSHYCYYYYHCKSVVLICFFIPFFQHSQLCSTARTDSYRFVCSQENQLNSITHPLFVSFGLLQPNQMHRIYRWALERVRLVAQVLQPVLLNHVNRCCNESKVWRELHVIKAHQLSVIALQTQTSISRNFAAFETLL